MMSTKSIQSRVVIDDGGQTTIYADLFVNRFLIVFVLKNKVCTDTFYYDRYRVDKVLIR